MESKKLKKNSAYLLDLVLIASICTWDIIGERFWSSELVVRRRRGNNVSLTSNLSSKACYWSSDCKRRRE